MNLNFYLDKVEAEISNLGLPVKPERLYSPLNYFLNLGGKRLRPVLTLIATEFGGHSFQKSMDAALAIEFFHNFTLIHDDIMDEAPLRRGLPTVHEKWNQNVAILSGDVLLVKAYQLLSNQSKEHFSDLIWLFNKTAVEVCEGQQLDMDFESQDQVTIDEYIEMIRLKTSVLLGCALEFGFIVSNQNKENRDKIYSFGVNLGIAFQIQDDLLDLFGDPEKVGKQIGGDVKSNKKTLLYLLAEEKSKSNSTNELDSLKNMTDLDLRVQKTKELYLKIGVLEEAKKYQEKYYQKALETLNSIEISNSKNALMEVVEFLFNREH
jgi:geranylgeranyl diphosphate synthase type II